MTNLQILKKAEKIAELKSAIDEIKKEMETLQSELLAYAENNANTWENIHNDKVTMEYVNGGVRTTFDKNKAKEYMTKQQYKDCCKEYTQAATIRVKRVKG